MLEPHEVDDLKFQESNSDEFLLVDYRSSIEEDGDWWSQAAFIHKDDVIQLRDWLNNWIASH